LTGLRTGTGEGPAVHEPEKTQSKSVPNLRRGAASTFRERADRAILLLLALVATLLAFRARVDPDLPGHLAYGMVHFQTGQLQHTDPYSYTAMGAPWINHEWAFEWLIAAAYSAFGTTGLLLVQGIAWTTTAVLVLVLLRRGTSEMHPAALLFTGYVAVSLPSVSVRPQLATFALFALLVLLLERARTGRSRGLIAVPLLFVLWTNLHGGFLAGLGVLVAYAAGLLADAALGRPVHGPRGDECIDRGRAVQVGVAALGAGLATLVNPYGVALHRWLLWSLGVPNPNISEWRSVALDAQGVTFVLLMLLVAAAFLHQGWRRIPLAHALPLVATAFLSLQYSRHEPFFVVLACATAAGPVTRLYRRWVPRRGRTDLTESQYQTIRALAIVFGILTVFWRFGLEDLKLRLSPEHDVRWPTGAIAFVDRVLAEDRAQGRAPRNALVQFDWAQLAIWRWYPQLRVHYDGRHRTVYPLAIENEHFAFLGLEATEDWGAAVRNRPTNLVIVDVGTSADARMRVEPGWRLAYVDDIAAVFVPGEGGAPEVGSQSAGPIAFETRLTYEPPALPSR
jgi:hypothetical protein